MSIEILRDILGEATIYDADDNEVLRPERVLHITAGTLDKALNEYAAVWQKAAEYKAKVLHRSENPWMVSALSRRVLINGQLEYFGDSEKLPWGVRGSDVEFRTPEDEEAFKGGKS